MCFFEQNINWDYFCFKDSLFYLLFIIFIYYFFIFYFCCDKTRRNDWWIWSQKSTSTRRRAISNSIMRWLPFWCIQWDHILVTKLPKNRPKCSPTLLLTDMMHNLFCKKVAQIKNSHPGLKKALAWHGLVVSSPTDTAETGAMGREIEACRGKCRVVAFFKKIPQMAKIRPIWSLCLYY
jgi:hypothetical protein